MVTAKYVALLFAALLIAWAGTWYRMWRLVQWYDGTVTKLKDNLSLAIESLAWEQRRGEDRAALIARHMARLEHVARIIGRRPPRRRWLALARRTARVMEFAQADMERVR